MKTQINETKRMQQLAGILKEAIGDDIALNFSNTKPNTPPGATPGVSPTNQEDTSDEKRLGRIVASISTLIAALGGIDNPMELDGLFREILKHTKLKEIPKTVVMQKLKATLDQTAPNSSTITTKSATDKTT